MPASERREHHVQGLRRRSVWIWTGGLVLAVVLWGGYSGRWSWTGINGHTATLWDWLHLLLLPAAFALLPLGLSPRARLTPRHKSVVMAAIAAFALLVLFGYVIPWAWTGFSGNKLWDWLELLVLPLAVALTPLYGELRARWSRRHTIVALGGLGGFAVIVAGGYLAAWGWTGFHGNTLWDWMHLLLLPLLLPTIVVPALIGVTAARLIIADEEKELQEEPESLDERESQLEKDSGEGANTSLR
jgi:hypothetical protein